MKLKTKTLKKRTIYINSKLLWDILLSKSIKFVFGLPSSSIDGILNYIPKQIQWINVGIELQNGFIAQVYGSYNNNVGILIVGTGPGIATAISSIKNAEFENKPLLVITTYDKKLVDFQYWNITNISKTMIKYVFHVKKSSEMKETMLLAYEIAKINNTCVLLIINIDILSEKTESLGLSIPKINYIKEQSESYISKTKVDLAKINNTKLLVIIGKTNNRADHDTIHNFIKHNNLPYVNTWKARTIYNTGLYCGRIGSLGNHSANYALCNCDTILLIGMVDEIQYNYTEYHYDIFSIPFINKNKRIYIINYKNINIPKNIQLYVYPYLNTILDVLSIQTNHEWLINLHKTTKILLFDLPRISLLEKYAYIASQVHRNNKLDIPVTTGVGNHWYSMGKYMNMITPNCWESDCIWASIGTGIANGLGIYYATKKPVWVFEGDGGLLFSANNLFYLLNNIHIPLTITIFVNHLYGAIYSSYIIKGYTTNQTNNVDSIPYINLLPNCHIFEDLSKYFEYLNRNPVSNTLRFIIINLGKNNENSNVYEINMNSNYERYLKNNMYKEIIESKLVLSENSNS